MKTLLIIFKHLILISHQLVNVLSQEKEKLPKSSDTSLNKHLASLTDFLFHPWRKIYLQYLYVYICKDDANIIIFTKSSPQNEMQHTVKLCFFWVFTNVYSL